MTPNRQPQAAPGSIASAPGGVSTTVSSAAGMATAPSNAPSAKAAGGSASKAGFGGDEAIGEREFRKGCFQLALGLFVVAVITALALLALRSTEESKVQGPRSEAAPLATCPLPLAPIFLTHGVMDSVRLAGFVHGPAILLVGEPPRRATLSSAAQFDVKTHRAAGRLLCAAAHPTPRIFLTKGFARAI